MKRYIPVIVGIVTGLISSRTLFAHSWSAIVFWGVVGLLLGFFTMRDGVRRAGLTYGFTMSLAFLLFGYGGALNTLPVFTLFAIGLSLVGALGGWCTVWVGSRVRPAKYDTIAL